MLRATALRIWQSSNQPACLRATSSTVALRSYGDEGRPNRQQNQRRNNNQRRRQQDRQGSSKPSKPDAEQSSNSIAEYHQGYIFPNSMAGESDPVAMLREQTPLSKLDFQCKGNSFQSQIIETKRVVNMTRGGRRATMSALVVVGNYNGAAGFAVGKADDIGSAIDKAVRKAIDTAVFIPRFENRTLHHAIQTKYLRTKVFLRPKRPDGGLKAHRSIMAIASLAGIKDMGADVVGSSNPLNVVRAAFQALTSQVPATEKAAQRGKSLLYMEDPEAVPRVVARNPNPRFGMDKTRPADERKQAHEWMYDFPLEVTLPNIRLAIDAVDTLEAESDPQALQQYMARLPSEMQLWLKAMPKNAWVHTQGMLLDDVFRPVGKAQSS